MFLLDAFRTQALVNPGCLVESGGHKNESPKMALTYRQIWNISEMLGAHLLAQTARGELPAGEVVAVIGYSEPAMLACALAAAKSNHPHWLLGGGPVAYNYSLAHGYSAVLTATTAQADDLRQLMTDESAATGCTEPSASPSVRPLVLDAELMLSYIVPGMADDSSCNCGDDDCSHGPFLQECMPSGWIRPDSLMMMTPQDIAPTPEDKWIWDITDGTDLTITVVEHNQLLDDSLTTLKTPRGWKGIMAIGYTGEEPLGLNDGNISGALAKGLPIRLYQL